MTLYELRPQDGIGPFRLGMTRTEAEAVRRELGLPPPPESFYLEYEGDRLSRIGLNRSDEDRIIYDGMDLMQIHAETVLAALRQKAAMECDCEDPDLAWTCYFPNLGLELWREEPYHPKLLSQPGFQQFIRQDPCHWQENLSDLQRGWCFEQVWVEDTYFRTAFPLEIHPAPDYSTPKTEPPMAAPTPEEMALLIKKYRLEPPEQSGRGDRT